MRRALLLAVGIAVTIGLLIKVFAGEPGSAGDPLVTKSFLEESYAWRITTIPAGEKLILELGSEAVLRSGKAIAIGTKSGGLNDLTLGQDLFDQTVIPADHYIVSASSDGRGMQAITTSVFMTRGLVR